MRSLLKRLPGFGAVLTAEVRDVVDAAILSVREPNDDGPRVAVISRALRGAFIYSEEEAERRLRLAFPELSDRSVARAVRHLESRIRLKLHRVATPERRSWVHGWKDESDTSTR